MRRKRPALFRGPHFEAEIIVLCVRWYLRFSLSFRNLEEIMAERNLSVDHVTIWRWVQRYAPELNRRCRPELRKTNGSWRCDETYLRVAGKWTYLYRAVDSTGATIDFLLSARRDADAAKRFFQKTLRSPGHPRPRVINVDGNPSYPKAISEPKRTGELGRRCRCRPVRYLNNIVEQDHRAIKRRVRAMQDFRAFQSAWRTIQGIETVNRIRKRQVRWLARDDIAGQAAFADRLFGLTPLRKSGGLHAVALLCSGLQRILHGCFGIVVAEFRRGCIKESTCGGTARCNYASLQHGGALLFRARLKRVAEGQ